MLSRFVDLEARKEKQSGSKSKPVEVGEEDSMEVADEDEVGDNDSVNDDAPQDDLFLR